MSVLAPQGGVLWLLGHELRLSWRRMLSGGKLGARGATAANKAAAIHSLHAGGNPARALKLLEAAVQRARSVIVAMTVAASSEAAALAEARRAGHHHCAFGSETVEPPSCCAVVSNRLASMTKFASMLTTDSPNGASRRVPPTGASAISISRPSERYLTRAVDARWPAIGS